MVAGDFRAAGSGTLSSSGVGTYASVTVSESGMAASDNVQITVTSALPSRIGGKKYNVYVSDISADEFTVKSDEVELPEDVTFDYIIHATA